EIFSVQVLDTKSRGIFDYTYTDIPKLVKYRDFIKKSIEGKYLENIDLFRSKLGEALNISTQIYNLGKEILSFFEDNHKQNNTPFINFLKDKTKHLLVKENNALEPSSPLMTFLKSTTTESPKLKQLSDDISNLIDNKKVFQKMKLKNQFMIINDFVKYKLDIPTYVDYYSARIDTIDHGLKPFVDALDNGSIIPEKLKENFKFNYLHKLLLASFDTKDSINEFRTEARKIDIKKLQETDQKIRSNTVDKIKYELKDNYKFRGIQPGEIDFLNKELANKRHKSIRHILSKAQNLTSKLAPCFLMSPLSIAQYLPIDFPKFDLVIFDEASQIPVSDAIGAIARGKAAIVVGDPRQLPPTTFFKKNFNEDDFDENDQQTLESILDECNAISTIENHKLLWHYRSRSESLISFSNQKYYDSKLVTFPAPYSSDMYVSFHYVENGVYDRKKSSVSTASTNLIEAKAIIDDVLKTLKSDWFTENNYSLGIVTFNQKQMVLIQDLLDNERQKDPSLDAFFSESLEEPVLIKNIENIQGDERDIIYFSICYGYDTEGKISMNFGPINQIGGERRLNVAITRARRRIKVFSSFLPTALKAKTTTSRGLNDLIAFLEYAKGTYTVEATSSQDSTTPEEDISENLYGFHQDHDLLFSLYVASELEKKGWKVNRNIGVSDFRIDLGVLNPDDSDNYFVGIECDGKSYRMSKTALDRDYLRQRTLEGLGWSIIHIWSLDWYRNKEQALNNLHAQLQQLWDEKKNTKIINPLKPEPDSIVEPTDISDQEAPDSDDSEIDANEPGEDGDDILELESPESVSYPYQSPNPLISMQFPRKISKDYISNLDLTPLHVESIHEMLSDQSPVNKYDFLDGVRNLLGINRLSATERNNILTLTKDLYFSMVEKDPDHPQAEPKLFFSNTHPLTEPISGDLLNRLSSMNIDNVPLLSLINLASESDSLSPEELQQYVADKLERSLPAPNIKKRVSLAVNLYLENQNAELNS
ncbi:MAG: hypothetical protein LBE27_08890, partial [Deltaproteobacteria bacterium]|nr:hypothetical protein [Deltaproteobacteria bacterium]